MARFISLFPLLLLLPALFFLSTERTLGIWGIAPNLFLIFFIATIFLLGDAWVILALILSFLCMIFFLTPFWFLEAAFLTLLVGLSYFGRRMLTGERFLDFLIVLAVCTVLFYVPSYFVSFSLAKLAIIGKEAIYNLLIGACAWMLGTFGQRKSRAEFPYEPFRSRN